MIAALFTKKLPKLAPSGPGEVGAEEVGSEVGVGAIKILAALTIIDSSSSVMCIFPSKKAEEVQPVRSWIKRSCRKKKDEKSNKKS